MLVKDAEKLICPFMPIPTGHMRSLCAARKCMTWRLYSWSDDYGYCQLLGKDAIDE